MSKSEIALIKKMYKKIQDLEKEVHDLRDEIRIYKYTKWPNDNPPIYPSQPVQPIGPYFDTPTPKWNPDRGPWLGDKIYANSGVKLK